MPQCPLAPTRRRRTLALAAAAAVLAAPLLAGATAHAEPSSTVTFTGGCGLLGLGASSTPDLNQVSVAAGDQLRFANRLGQRAVMAINGEPSAEIPAGGAADVTFHEGPVMVSLRVSCLLGKPVGAVRVEVLAAAAEPEPGPPSSAPAPTQQAPAHPTGSASTGRPAADPPAAAAPPAFAGSERGWTSPEASQAGVVEQGAGPPPRPAPPPGSVPADGPMSVPGGGDDLSGSWGIGSGSDAGDPAAAPPAGEATEISAAAQSTVPDQGSIGLLALVATVCVVGVSAGAIRALISQRANRSKES
jgi:hypothetical protein